MALSKLTNSINPPVYGPHAKRRAVTVEEFNRLIDEIQDGGETTTGPIVTTDTTEATSKDTGSIITEGGIGVEKSIVTGLGITVGTNVVFVKEVSHSVYVAPSTTAATPGGDLNLVSGAGNGAYGGTLYLQSSNMTGSGADSGPVILTSGTNEDYGTGDATVKTGDDVGTGTTGSTYIKTGDSTGGVSGSVYVGAGSSGSATSRGSVINLGSSYNKPDNATVNSGGSISAVQLLGGGVLATGGTGNWQLPSAADLITAMGGGVSENTTFDFVFNASGMTVANTATLVVGAGMTVASSPAITGGGSLTVTQGTQAAAGFKVVFHTSSACKIYRMW